MEKDASAATDSGGESWPHGGRSCSAVNGAIYQAQVELGYAWDMLEVLVQLTMEAKEGESLPLEGWFGLLAAVQERVGAGRIALGKYQGLEL